MCKLQWIAIWLTIITTSPTYGEYDDMEGILNYFSKSSDNYTKINLDISALHDTIYSEKLDENKIINILIPTTDEDRQILVKNYEKVYHINLVNVLRANLTGTFEEIIVAFLTPIHQYVVQEIYDAIRSSGSDENALIEILCLHYDDFKPIKSAYLQTFGFTIEHDLQNFTIGDFQKLMIACNHGLRSHRTNNSEIYGRKKHNFHDVQHRLSSRNEKELLIDTITKSSFDTITKAVIEFPKRHRVQLENLIKQEFPGDIQRALLEIVNYAKGREFYFAHKLNEILKAKNVDHRSLIRIVKMNNSVDLKYIAIEYKKYYRNDLKTVLTNKLSGAFQKCLYVLFSL